MTRLRTHNPSSSLRSSDDWGRRGGCRWWCNASNLRLWRPTPSAAEVLASEEPRSPPRTRKPGPWAGLRPRMQENSLRLLFDEAVSRLAACSRCWLQRSCARSRILSALLEGNTGRKCIRRGIFASGICRLHMEGLSSCWKKPLCFYFLQNIKQLENWTSIFLWKLRLVEKWKENKGFLYTSEEKTAAESGSLLSSCLNCFGN